VFLRARELKLTSGFFIFCHPNPFYMICKTLLLIFLPFLAFTQESNEYQKKWIKQLNSGNISALQEMYLDQAGLFSENELYISPKQREDILKEVKNQFGQFDGYAEAFQTKGNQGHLMTLGYLRSGEKVYPTIIAWRMVNGEYKKEFESIAELPSSEFDFPLEKLDLKRREWEKHSNNHDPESLIKKVYTPQSYYFNQGRKDKGREQIIKRYNYMTQPGWKIRLEKAGLIPVSSLQVWEIGKYYSNGVGQYLLIWEKQPDGSWQIALDFNF
jgi:ketosteroid isomerase-like protein